MRRALLPLLLASAACTPAATQTQVVSADVPPPAATAEGLTRTPKENLTLALALALTLDTNEPSWPAT